MSLLSKSILCFCWLISCFSLGATNYEPFFEPSHTSELVWGENPNTIIPIEISSSEDLALYGPGGDPIGGLPVANATWFLLGAVMIYAVYKSFQRKNTLNSYKL